MEDLKTSVSTHSPFYEQLIEHLFISEVLQEMRFRYNQYPEVLKAEVDASGYDLVIECNKVIRHIQLKTGMWDASKQSVKLNMSLAEKLNGCAIWIEWKLNEKNRIELIYRFFGNPPGQSMPDISANDVGKHDKGNSLGEKLERPAIRVVKKAKFRRMSSITELVQRLFILDDFINIS